MVSHPTARSRGDCRGGGAEGRRARGRDAVSSTRARPFGRDARARFVATALIGALASLWSFGGCGLATEGIPGHEPAPKECQGPEDCDDANPCTIDNCGADKTCVLTNASDGVPTQIPGDCKQVVCRNGQKVETPDDTDVDDGNDCTKDTCTGGKPNHDAKAREGASCTLGTLSGTCGAGVCQVKCKAGDKCDDSNPCTEDACNVGAGTCEYTPLHGKVVNDASNVDCVETRCVQDKATEVPDDSEIPDDGLECTIDACSNKLPSHPPKPTGTGCGVAGDQKCNPQGVCVGCNSPGDCVGVDDTCKFRTCDGTGQCGIQFAGAGTLLPNQNPGDCQQVQCDGLGNPISVALDSDLPGSDGDDCTQEACAAGAPVHPPLTGTPCNQNGGKVCLNGSCVDCIDNSQCTPGQKCGGATPNVCCSPQTCATLGKTCGTFPDGCGSMLNCSDGLKNGDETDVDCGGTTTCALTCPQGGTCAADSGCSTGFCADGFCCDNACTTTCRGCSAVLTGGTNGICANLKKGTDDDFPAGACSGNSTCNGSSGASACRKKNGQVCALTSECASNFCPPQDLVCCATGCTGNCLACKASKNGGSDGTCGPVTAATDPDHECSGTQCCSGSGTCVAGNCP